MQRCSSARAGGGEGSGRVLGVLEVLQGAGLMGFMKCELLGAGGGAAGWALGSGKEVEGGAVLSTPKRI